MTNIDGYAFTKDYEVEMNRRSARFKELEAKHPGIVKQMIESRRSSYAQAHYAGAVPEGIELSHLDIAILCDHGNTCFGGFVDRTGNNFRCTIYTD